MMKKRLISIACGVLCCSMLFAACNKGATQGITTTAEPSKILTTTEPETTAPTAASTTQGTTKGSTTKVSTTKKKVPSTTKKSGSSSGKKNSDLTIVVPSYSYPEIEIFKRGPAY